VIRRGLGFVTAAASIAILATSTLPSGPAGASSASSDSASSGGPARAVPPLARPGIIGAGLNIQMTPAEAVGAARRCASWASKAGFANNGRRGHLVIAVAIGMAESGCRASACFNNNTRRACTRSGTRHSRDSIDRGAWQINSHYWKNISNRCAYHGLCSGRRAYRLVSAYGTYFRPWRTYITGRYRRFLQAARAAVRELRTGTLTTAYIGSCAAYPSDHRRAKVRLANCGSAAKDQMWTRSFAKLRTRGGLCLGARFRRSGPVTVQRCSGRWRQQWWARRGFTLYNRGARKCLTDPGGSIRPGHALSVGWCLRKKKDKAWYRP
jgi:Lysozyme like domain/Ricin-type beta-trefoil lectin domain